MVRVVHALHDAVLGECLQSGVGVAKNPVEAVSWYRAAAASGLPEAQDNLGFCHGNICFFFPRNRDCIKREVSVIDRGNCFSASANANTRSKNS